MKINNNLLIEKINKAIISHNKDTQVEQISLITNGEIQNEELKKLVFLSIDISDISIEEKDIFFEELGNVLESMELNNLSLYSSDENEPMAVNMSFLSKVNKGLEYLQISGIDLSNVSPNVFNQLEDLKVLGLGNNNITDLKMLSQINENIAIDVGNNPMNNASINEVVEEIKNRQGKMVFNGHPFLNAIVAGLKSEKINLANFEIPENRISEMFQFFNDYKIQVPIKIEDYKKSSGVLENISSIIISGTKDISTEFLRNHPEIEKIQIIDEENRCDIEQEEPYSREEFMQIRQKIDEIKEKVVIPEDSDQDREKKIFMQVYKILGEMIDYNHYAITEEGRKDNDLVVTCRNLKDGLLTGKAVCAGYADILKNVLGEFGIKAKYISRNPEDIEKYAEKMGYEENAQLEDALGFEKTDIDEFVKLYGYQDDHGHAWNSIELDGNKYLCDLTWDASDIKIGKFPLAFCCPSLEEFNSTGEMMTHDMFETTEEGEISEFSSEDQLRFLGFSEEEIEKKLHFSIDDLEALLENYSQQQKMEAVAVSFSSEIKASDFDGIEKAFDDKEKEEQVDYDK